MWLIKYLKVTIPDNSCQRLIQRSLMLNITETIDKDKITIAVNNCSAFKTALFLILLFHHKGFFDLWEHGNYSFSCCSFRCVYGKCTAFIISLVIVDQCMIYTDRIIFQVNIAPSQTGDFTYTHSCPKHDNKDRIPSVILSLLAKIRFKQFLLRNCKSTSFCYFKVTSLFKLFQSVIGRIITKIIVLNSKL